VCGIAYHPRGPILLNTHDRHGVGCNQRLEVRVELKGVVREEVSGALHEWKYLNLRGRDAQ
jgi:hypothetical protein